MFGKKEENRVKNGKKVKRTKSCKKGLTVKGGGAIIINVVARTANASELRETIAPILENDTEKKKSFDEQISQILKELNALRN